MFTLEAPGSRPGIGSRLAFLSLATAIAVGVARGDHWGTGGVRLTDSVADQILPLAVADGQGGAYIGWTDYRNGFPDVYAQRIAASGAIAPGWSPLVGIPVCAAAGPQGLAAMTLDGVGGLLVAWRDGRDDRSGIYAQRLTAAGEIWSGWPVNGSPACTTCVAA